MEGGKGKYYFMVSPKRSYLSHDFLSWILSPVEMNFLQVKDTDWLFLSLISELTPDLSDEDSRQLYNLTNLTPETQQADNPLVIEKKPQEKSEKRNKKKSLKAKKTNKKRKNSPKKGVAVSGMFARLVGRGHTNEQQGNLI